ncbi:hypothetical protein D1007_62347 [Hordeum vulgare]|nr:hypothetical protein D1007_62347 [Hordeum vulgare]
MTGGEELSALVGNGATVHGRAWGERGNDDELTTVQMVLLRGSGVRRRERIDGRGPTAGGGRRWRWGDAELGEASASAEMTRPTRRSCWTTQRKVPEGRSAAARARARGNGGNRREEKIREEGETCAGEWIEEAPGSLSPLSRCPGVL